MVQLTPVSTARSALLDEVMTYVAANGLVDRSLRELAEGVGSSHRMLIYHFGSRTGLIAAIVSEMERRQRELLTQVADQATDRADIIRATWHRVTDPAVRPFVRLFFEVLALAADRRPETQEFAARLTKPWIDAGREAADKIGIDMTGSDLHVAVAVMRGLLIDVIATGEIEVATAALERFIETSRGDAGPQ